MNKQSKYINHSVYKKVIFWYSLLSVGPRIIIGTSLPFYIFIFLFFRFPTFLRRTFVFKNWESILVLFLTLCGITSAYLSKNPQLSARYTINFVYWQILILFVYNNRNHIPWNTIIRAIFMGALFFVFQRFILRPFLPRIPLLGYSSQNSFAFLLISFAPIALLYLRRVYSKRMFYIGMALFGLVAIINGSRAGFGILMIQIGLLFYVDNMKRINLFFIITVVSGLLFFNQQRQEIGNILYSINPEYGELLLTENALEKDVSFLMRRAQFYKSQAIFKEHPYFGIGLMNYTSYSYKFKRNFKGADYVIYKDFIDKLETHNSYLTVITELGGVAFLLLILLFIITIRKYLSKISEGDFAMYAFFISFLGILTHFYLVNIIINSYVWFTLGLIIAYINRTKKLPPILAKNYVK